MAAHKELPPLPPIPSKRYFSIGEVSELCDVKDYVLRYWEEEFAQLRPLKRAKRRYYQQHDVLLIRRIRELLYRDGFTISGARQQLSAQGLGNLTDEVTTDKLSLSQEGQHGFILSDTVKEELIGRLKKIREFLRNK